MEVNIDRLIKFFDRYNKSSVFELEEQDTATPAATAGGSTTTSSTSSGKSPKKWETGITRGKANPLGNTVWSSGRKFGSTYMNDPKHKWTSGRTMGKTGGSDYA